MNYFDWWPFELLILAHFGIGLLVLLGMAFVKAPTEQKTARIVLLSRSAVRRSKKRSEVTSEGSERLAA
jgi:hypothetical protein